MLSVSGYCSIYPFLYSDINLLTLFLFIWNSFLPFELSSFCPFYPTYFLLSFKCPYMCSDTFSSSFRTSSLWQFLPSFFLNFLPTFFPTFLPSYPPTNKQISFLIFGYPLSLSSDLHSSQTFFRTFSLLNFTSFLLNFLSSELSFWNSGVHNWSRLKICTGLRYIWFVLIYYTLNIKSFCVCLCVYPFSVLSVCRGKEREKLLFFGGVFFGAELAAWMLEGFSVL